MKSAEQITLTLADELEYAFRFRHDVGDVLAAACRIAAARVNDDLTKHRRGSWEAVHVRGLSAGWEG